jgi:hypothetical protein
VTLGYEPQWLLIKEATQSGNSWSLIDNMRGLTTDGPSGHLRPNTSDAEDTTSVDVRPTATGFQPISSSGRVNRSGETFIYIAIRRGPMKVPTSGTSVFASVINTGTSSGQTNTSNFPVDLSIDEGRATNYGAIWFDRLRGFPYLISASATNEVNSSPTYYIGFDSNTSIFNKDYGALSLSYVNWMFRRAPSFFDEVCYTGTGSNTTFTHNLTVVPELIIVKRRDANGAWDSYCSALANTEYVVLSTTAAKATGATRWNSTTPTSSVFSVGTSTTTNASAGTYVAYLFATTAGVSKVGSYTGTGTTLQIDCGFTAGARFVLIKRTDDTGSWYVWDSSRGIVSGNDPYLLLNSTAAEVTNTDYIDAYSAGFEISSTAPAEINASGGTYIFLSIA